MRAEAEAWARHIARFTQGLRVVPARNSHITLAFLGELDEFETEEVISAAESSISPVRGLALGAPAWLPKRRPRSLVLDIHDDRGELLSLQSRLARELKAMLGWSEGRPYRPHLTCARTGRGFDPAGSSLPVSPSITFSAASVSVYLSRLQPEGAEYEALASFPAEGGSRESAT
ncbi:MAG: RNA 2',3'-cyclic phosphodiesterase [Solirubrobacterales bacterium]|nr:RNA 2',3'-cyclic phosphodiesterase [Solirubrobacterales bacterium]